MHMLLARAMAACWVLALAWPAQAGSYPDRPVHLLVGFAPGENFLRWRLLEPAAREFFVDWDEATEVAVSGLRGSVAGDLEDPRLRLLIDELSAASDRFRELWARADVGYRTGVLHMRHPVVGDLYLRRTRFSVPDSDAQLFIYHPEPGSDSAKALGALGPS